MVVNTRLKSDMSEDEASAEHHYWKKLDCALIVLSFVQILGKRYKSFRALPMLKAQLMSLLVIIGAIQTERTSTHPLRYAGGQSETSSERGGKAGTWLMASFKGLAERTEHCDTLK